MVELVREIDINRVSSQNGKGVLHYDFNST